MVKSFTEVARVPVHLERGEKYQVELIGNNVVISKESRAPEWEDVTRSCYLEFRDSQHCSGRYIVVMHYGEERRQAAIIGTAGIQVQHDFKIEKPAGAYTSFKIYRKIKERR